MKIAQIRKTKNITQDELAKRCATTQQQIAKIEKGIVDPKLSTLYRIADALGCETRDLLYSKREFLKEIEDAVRIHHLNLKKIDLMSLNELCAREKRISPFHHFWERVEIRNNTLVFREENHE